MRIPRQSPWPRIIPIHVPGKIRTGSLLLSIIFAATSCQTVPHDGNVAGNVAQSGKTGKDSRKIAHWVPLGLQGEVPFPGEDFALIYDPPRHRIILYGGKNDKNENVNQTWAMDLATKHWTNFTSDKQNPPPREDHTVLYDPVGDRMILFGGENNAGTENTTWTLDLKSMIWTDITTPDAPASEDHTAIYDTKRKRMVIYGGQDGGFMLTTPYALDLDPTSPAFQRWTPLTVKENKKQKNPVGRVDHVAMYDPAGDRMIIFGGWEKDENYFMNDTWAFDFEEMMWKEHARKSRSRKPPPRRHAAVAYDKKHDWMLVFGGTGGGLLNDVWAFDLELNEWLNLTPGPPPRKDHAAIFDPRNNVMIIYGGETVSDGAKLHDLWQLMVP